MVLIATVLVNHSPSGVVSYYNRLADDLQKQGINVRILDASATPFVWRKSMGVLKRAMSLFGSGSQALYEEFAYFTSVYWTFRRQRNTGVDLIHAQDARSGAAAFLALGKRVPVVLTCHFNDDPVTELTNRFSIGEGLRRRLVDWYSYLFSHIKSYVFVSDYAYQKSKHLLPDDVQKITIRNTVAIESDDNSTEVVPTDRIVISNVGYIDERKNQQLLLRIGYGLKQRGFVNFAIWFIGEGPKRAEYEQLTKQLNLTEHVTFYGQQSVPWKLVAQSDLYIHTALNDNCPYSIIEALAVQTPVLALPVGGIPEMLPKQAGLLHGKNIDELTDEVAAYFDTDRREQLRQAQAAHADLHFNHRKSLTKLISFYHQTQQAA